jgi:hypothetical protein
MLFPLPAWGFSRLHPADLPSPLVRRLIDDCPNVAALKVEGGMPNFMEAVEAHRHFHKEVVISSPLEYEYVPLAQIIDIPFCGTNYAAYYGPWVPRMHKLIQEGNFDEATQIWYKLDPARKAFASLPMAAGGLLNRMIWKYGSWLQGYNGGAAAAPHATPLRTRHATDAPQPGSGGARPHQRSRRGLFRRPTSRLSEVTKQRRRLVLKSRHLVPHSATNLRMRDATVVCRSITTTKAIMGRA